MWVHAFNTIRNIKFSHILVKYKRKAEEMKQNTNKNDHQRDLDRNVEDDGFQEEEEQEEEREDQEDQRSNIKYENIMNFLSNLFSFENINILSLFLYQTN